MRLKITKAHFICERVFYDRGINILNTYIYRIKWVWETEIEIDPWNESVLQKKSVCVGNNLSNKNVLTENGTANSHWNGLSVLQIKIKRLQISETFVVSHENGAFILRPKNLTLLWTRFQSCAQTTFAHPILNLFCWCSTWKFRFKLIFFSLPHLYWPETWLTTFKCTYQPSMDGWMDGWGFCVCACVSPLLASG